MRTAPPSLQIKRLAGTLPCSHDAGNCKKEIIQNTGLKISQSAAESVAKYAAKKHIHLHDQKK
jgi:hypothetical protein